MIEIRKHSGIYTLEAEQVLPISLDDAWSFFSNPSNLARITPERMLFQITSGAPDQMYAGQIVSYRMGLFPLLRSSWVTEITHVSVGKYFVDEQRFGPYAMWHHEHRFEETEKGLLMRDKISYKLPLGALGRLFHGLLIKPSLMKIFTFRQNVLRSMFA